MVELIFENESFKIFLMYKNLSYKIESLCYLICPKYLNVPIVNFKYLAKLHQSLLDIGAVPLNNLDPSFFDQESLEKHVSISKNKFQYLLPIINWKNLKKVSINAYQDFVDLNINFKKEEKVSQDCLVNLLNNLNDDIYLFNV